VIGRGPLWVAVWVLLLGAEVGADPAIGRRLAALRVLAAPAPASLRVGRAAPFSEPCAARAGWRRIRGGRRAQTLAAVHDASLRFGVDAALIRSVIREESAGNPDAVSSAGAMGLMQLMPGTAAELGVVCAFDPRENVMAGTRYLRRMRDRLGSWRLALAGYHAGPAAVEAGRLSTTTTRYVARVLRRWAEGRGARDHATR
jgi:soluble lytic murein transglycosylase-like protein